MSAVTWAKGLTDGGAVVHRHVTLGAELAGHVEGGGQTSEAEAAVNVTEAGGGLDVGVDLQRADPAGGLIADVELGDVALVEAERPHRDVERRGKASKRAARGGFWGIWGRSPSRRT